MKRFLILLSILFCCIASAATETINWYVDNNIYTTTTCTTGGDIILPTTPTKHGYDFTGWVSYTPIEYLESTGTQYIDTGYIPNNFTGIEIKIKNTNNNLSANNAFFGSGENAGSKSFELYIWGSTLQFIYSSVTTQSLPGANPFTVNWHGNNVQYIYNDYEIYFGLPALDFTSPYNMYLFANTRPSGTSKGVSRIYYCKIYDKNTLVRDFIPVLDQTGIPCMYDKVTRQFFYNQGIGRFITGPSLLN